MHLNQILLLIFPEPQLLLQTNQAALLLVSALKDLPGQKVAILSYIDPLVAILVSVVWLKEGITIPQIIGGFLILGFTLWSELPTEKNK